MVPTSDNGFKGLPQRIIIYTLYRLDGKTPPIEKWYITEHQTDFNVAKPNGMSGGLAPSGSDLNDQNQFPDTIGCLMGCPGTSSSQTFTISRNTGVCGQPSYGQVENTQCNSDYSGTIVVHVPSKGDYGVLRIAFSTGNVTVNGLYKWPGVN